jgi:uroporphyrinogen III methyltransferase/synthase
LDEIESRLTPASKLRPPVIVIVGPVTQLAKSMSWIHQRPLHGQTILVTRPADQADALADPLSELGAQVVRQPVIEIAPPESYAEIDAAIQGLDKFDVVAFSSRNGVRFFLDRLVETVGDVRRLAGVQIATVGSQTAIALSAYHLQADIIPDDFHARSLAAILAPHAAGKQFLLVRASRGGDDLSTGLADGGGSVTEIVAYCHRDLIQPDPSISESLRDGKIDWVTVTSSASATSLARMFGDDLKKTRIASLSHVTSATLRDLGLQVAAEANPFTMQGLIDSIASTVHPK